MIEEKQTIEMTTMGIFKVILVILGLIFIFIIRDIILMFLAALIIAAALDAPISWLQRKKVPRMLGTIIVYAVILIVIASLLYLLLPPLASELRTLGNNLPIYLEKIKLFQAKEGLFLSESGDRLLNQQQILLQLANRIANSASSIFNTTVNIFGGFVSAFIILIIAIYFNSRVKDLRRFVFYFVPKKYGDLAIRIIRQIRYKMVRWLWGRFILSLFVALSVFLGLSLLGVRYALLLAVLAGILDVVPYIGPTIAAIPAIIIASLESVLLAFAVILLYLFVNQILEAFIIQPWVMKKAVGVNPIFLILAVLVGGRLGGLLGVIFAIPAVAILNVLIQEFINFRKSA